MQIIVVVSGYRHLSGQQLACGGATVQSATTIAAAIDNDAVESDANGLDIQSAVSVASAIEVVSKSVTIHSIVIYGQYQARLIIIGGKYKDQLIVIVKYVCAYSWY
jgi:hypothetical protein